MSCALKIVRRRSIKRAALHHSASASGLSATRAPGEDLVSSPTALAREGFIDAKRNPGENIFELQAVPSMHGSPDKNAGRAVRTASGSKAKLSPKSSEKSLERRLSDATSSKDLELGANRRRMVRADSDDELF
jgi:hypothetical protein